jgi:WD40 repeat protein
VSRIFLSHSSRDSRQAVALKQWLIDQTPPLANEIFLDVDPDSGLRTGTRWKDALRQANSRCEAVICLLSQNWEASHECKVEYRTAENLNKQIFVARLQPSTGDDLTSEWQRCDLFGDSSMTTIDIGDGTPVSFATAGLYRLRDGIRGAGIGADSFVWPPPGDPERAPYRGWEPLDEADAAVFFGRDAQIVRALDTLRGMRTSAVNSLFVVLGPSGTGKSSFLRAGLLPRLRREDRRFLVMDIVRPDRNVMVGDGGFAASIRATRAALGLTGSALGEIKSACLAGDSEQIVTWLREIRRAAAAQLLERGGDGDAAAPTLVLPLDQAEELFNAEAAGSAEPFMALLRKVLVESNDGELGLVVAATIRTDRYEVMQTHPQLAGLGTALFDELKPMPPTQFKEVIVGPAQRATAAGRPLVIAPDLVDRLLSDSGAGADTLPMLALTLARLYADYGSTGGLTLQQYEGMGGMQHVVHSEIDEILSSDPQIRARELSALRSAFVPWLATVNPDSGQPMRRVARVADLPPESRPLVDAMVAKRLMVKDIRDATPVVEVALESLLRQWDELAGWLREERKDLRDADDLVRSADSWRTSDRNPAWLLEGTRLAEAAVLVNRPGFSQRLTGVHDYLNASHERENQRRAAEEQRRHSELIAAQEREHAAQERARYAQEQQATAERHASTLRRRGHVLRAVVAVTAVVAVVAAVGFVWANNASNEATRQFREATSQRLTTDALAILDGMRPGSDIQALQQFAAAQRLSASTARDPLHDIVVATAGVDKLIQTPSEVLGVAVSPDGRLVAVGGEDSVRIWDAETGELRAGPMEGHEGGVANVVFSPDGSRLISSGADSTVRVWDVGTGQQDGEPLRMANTEGVRVVGFNAAGRRVLLLDSHGGAWAWDVEERGEANRVFPPEISKIAISTSANRLATARKNIIKIWDVQSGNQIGEDITAGDGDIFALEFSPDGSTLASGGSDKTVRLWDGATGGPIGAAMAQNSTEVVQLAFPPDGRYLAVAASDGSVRIYDTASQVPLGNPLDALDGFPMGLKIDEQGERMFVGGSDHTLRIFDLGMVVPKVGQAPAFSPDGLALVVGAADGAIRKWDGISSEPVEFDERMAAVNRMAYLPDGHNVVAADAGGTIQMWDGDTGERTGSGMAVPGVGIFSLDVSQAGDRILAGYADGTIRLWDIASRRLVRSPWRAGEGIITAVGFVDDESQVAAVVANENATLHVWDVADGDEVEDRPLGAAFAVAFGPDGRIAGGNIDGTVSFLTGIGGESVGEESTDGHADAVTAVNYNSDGSLAATASRDGSARVWDANTGTAIGQPLPKNPASILAVTFSPDNRVLATSADNNTTTLLPASASIGDLCAMLTVNMSEKQWNDWVSADIDYVKGCPDLPIAAD